MKLSDLELKIVTGIRNAVADRGEDWTYPDEFFYPDGSQDSQDWHDEGAGGCVNLKHDGTAACIVGYIAVDQGLPTVRVSDAVNDCQRWGLGGVVADLLILAQKSQDCGNSWGEVRDDFLEGLADAGYEVPE